MRILTSYYGKLKEIKKKHPEYFLVSASVFVPDEIKEAVDIWELSLAPSKSILDEYHQDKDQKKYVSRFKDERLSEVDWLEKLEQWEEKANKIGKEIDTVVLFCYEPIDTFCHRHILAEDLEKEFRTKVEEYGYEGYERDNYKLESISTDCLF